MKPELTDEYDSELEARVDRSADCLAAKHGMELTAEVMRRPGLLRTLIKSGHWLSDELRKLGATNEQLVEISFAHGQRGFIGDPWSNAVKSLARYKQGNPDKPGTELAEEVYNEMTGANAFKNN